MKRIYNKEEKNMDIALKVLASIVGIACTAVYVYLVRDVVQDVLRDMKGEECDGEDY